MKREDWIDDASDVIKQLKGAHGDERSPVQLRALAWAAAELLNLAPIALRETPGASAAPPAAAPAAKAAEGHRHKYGEDGRCTLAAPGGSGICSAMKRGATQAALPGAGAAGGGPSS